MFLALRELRRAKVRFGLLVAAIGLLVFLILIRALGQSALSVASLTLMGQWFRDRLDRAMALFTVIMSMGFMVAFPVVSSAVEKSGWRSAWAGIGIALLVVLAPLSALFVRRPPESAAATEETASVRSWGFGEALRTPAFWVMGLASAIYGLAASGVDSEVRRVAYEFQRGGNEVLVLAPPAHTP